MLDVLLVSFVWLDITILIIGICSYVFKLVRILENVAGQIFPGPFHAWDFTLVASELIIWAIDWPYRLGGYFTIYVLSMMGVNDILRRTLWLIFILTLLYIILLNNHLIQIKKYYKIRFNSVSLCRLGTYCS